MVPFNFTTSGADEDIFTTKILPFLETTLGYSDGYFDDGVACNMELLFDAQYTGTVTINGVDQPAWAKRVVYYNGDLTSLVIPTSGTIGQIRFLGGVSFVS